MKTETTNKSMSDPAGVDCKFASAPGSWSFVGKPAHCETSHIHNQASSDEFQTFIDRRFFQTSYTTQLVMEITYSCCWQPPCPKWVSRIIKYSYCFYSGIMFDFCFCCWRTRRFEAEGQRTTSANTTRLLARRPYTECDKSCCLPRSSTYQRRTT